MGINILLVCVGLVICFGGIYIRKLTSGLLGLIWGAILGFVGAVIMALSSGGLWYLMRQIEAPSTLIAVGVVAVVLCILSILFERLCSAINAFVSSFMLFSLVVCVVAQDIDQLPLMVAILTLASLVVSIISYIYHNYAYMLVAAFSGAFVASIGGIGLIADADAGEVLYEVVLGGNTEVSGILLIAIIVLGCVGFAVQKKRFYSKKTQNF